MTTPLNPQSDFNEITQLTRAARQGAVQVEWSDEIVSALQLDNSGCTTILVINE